MYCVYAFCLGLILYVTSFVYHLPIMTMNVHIVIKHHYVMFMYTVFFPLVAAAPNVSLMSPPTQSTPSRQQQQQTVSLASLMQVPNYSYMTVSSLLGGGTSSSPSEDHAHQQYSGMFKKR